MSSGAPEERSRRPIKTVFKRISLRAQHPKIAAQIASEFGLDPISSRVLAARGFNALLFDYRGYGRSEGNLEDEQGLYADADAAYEYVVRERNAPTRAIVLYGQSLGTAAVADLAARRECAAIILESGLSSGSDMASAALPWLPRSLHFLARNRFDSAHKLSQVHCAVLVTHGEPDPTIPTEQGRALFAAANEPKKLVIFPGADHNVFGSVGDKYLDMIAKFIGGVVRY